MFTFISRYKSLSIVVEPSDTGKIGRNINFANGVYETSDLGDAEFLRHHRGYKSLFYEIEEDYSKIGKAKGV